MDTSRFLPDKQQLVLWGSPFEGESFDVARADGGALLWSGRRVVILSLDGSERLRIDGPDGQRLVKVISLGRSLLALTDHGKIYWRREGQDDWKCKTGTLTTDEKSFFVLGPRKVAWLAKNSDYEAVVLVVLDGKTGHRTKTPLPEARQEANDSISTLTLLENDNVVAGTAQGWWLEWQPTGECICEVCLGGEIEGCRIQKICEVADRFAIEFEDCVQVRDAKLENPRIRKGVSLLDGASLVGKKLLLRCSTRTAIQIWDLKDHRFVRLCQDNVDFEKSSQAVAASPTEVIGGLPDDPIEIWNAITGKSIAQIEEIRTPHDFVEAGLCRTDEGELLFLAGPDTIAQISADTAQVTTFSCDEQLTLYSFTEVDGQLFAVTACGKLYMKQICSLTATQKTSS